MKINIILITLSSLALASIITIPDDYETIQEGITNSVDGDTVLVYPGTYLNPINFDGREIVLSSLFQSTNDSTYLYQTILSNAEFVSTVTFENQESANSILSGFSLLYCTAFEGSAISCLNGSSPTLEHLIVKHNSVYINEGFVGYGCGIVCRDNSSPVIRNCLIEDNNLADYSPFANGEGYGGGIALIDNSNATIEYCSILNNLSYKGGGIAVINSSPEILYSLISNNQSRKGGGIYSEDSELYISNVTMALNNEQGYGFLDEGGIMGSGDNQIYVVNSIFWENYPYSFVLEDGTGNLIITHSDIDGGANAIQLSESCNLDYSISNINLDPQFVDAPNGLFDLDIDSPCIDMGNPESPLDPDGTITDMGAFYFDQSDCGNYDYNWGDINSDGSQDILDIVFVVSLILGEEDISFLQMCIFDLNEDGEIDILDIVYALTPCSPFNPCE